MILFNNPGAKQVHEFFPAFPVRFPRAGTPNVVSFFRNYAAGILPEQARIAPELPGIVFALEVVMALNSPTRGCSDFGNHGSEKTAALNVVGFR